MNAKDGIIYIEMLMARHGKYATLLDAWCAERARDTEAAAPPCCATAPYSTNQQPHITQD